MTVTVKWSFVLRVATALAAAAWVPHAAAQELARQVSGAPDGDVAFQIKLKDDVQVCDHGVNVRRGGWRTVRSWGGGPTNCSLDRAEIRLRVRDGEVAKLEMRPPASVVEGLNLGFRDGDEAAAYLLGLAANSRHANVAEDAIAPAAMIDGVTVWPELLELARDRSVFEDVREQAVFWLSQEAGDAATAGLASIAEDDEENAEVRDAAVFALSQQPDEQSVPVLMELAVTSRHAKVRKSSMFWLAQSKDPRVLEFFEQILLGSVAVR